MEVSCISLSQSRKQCTVSVSAEELERFEPRAIKTMSADLDIPGFRKGNIPQEIARKYLRDDQLFIETARAAIAGLLPEVFSKQGLEPVSRPDIEIIKMAKGNEFVWRLTVSVLPEVKLGDWKTLRIIRKAVQVSDEEVDEALEFLRKSRAKIIAVARPVEIGDVAVIDFRGQLLDFGNNTLNKDDASKDSAASLPVGWDHKFILGEGHFVPGFEQQICGMKSGEVKVFSLVFPEQWHQKQLSGKNVSFTVTLKSVFKRILPELNDAFAQNLGKFADHSALKVNVKEGLLFEKRDKEKKRALSAAIDSIIRSTPFDIPQVLLEQEQEKDLDGLKKNLDGHGVDFSAYLAHLKTDESEFKKSLRDEAGRRIKTTLILREIAQEGIELSEDEVREKAQELLRQQNASLGVDPKDIEAYAGAMVRNEKALELIEKTIIVDS